MFATGPERHKYLAPKRGICLVPVVLWGLIPLLNVTVTRWARYPDANGPSDGGALILAVAIGSMGLMAPLAAKIIQKAHSTSLACFDGFVVFWTLGPWWPDLLGANSPNEARVLIWLVSLTKCAAFVRFYGWVLPSETQRRGG
jgi:hypothetical protein